MSAELQMGVISAGGGSYRYVPTGQVDGAARLPYALTVLLENVLRCVADPDQRQRCAERIMAAARSGSAGDEVEFSPARVLFQDFTGVPAFVDFAEMREACARLGGDPEAINPQIPCDLVIDHSVIADVAGAPDALERNMRLEFERNAERYTFLKWAQSSFRNVSIVEPGLGICHQLNIERFAAGVMLSDAGEVVRDAAALSRAGRLDKAADARGRESTNAGVVATGAAVVGVEVASAPSDASAQAAASAGVGCDGTSDTLPLAYFDTLVGTDSHTPTANGLGVLGWGVGGIEAEAAALGQPITILVPKVVGVRLVGRLDPAASAMDVALYFAQMLRAEGVVGCFVECFGPGLAGLSATQRTCIANMTPEYGSTCTLFPVDERTLEFLRLTGRSDAQCQLVRAYAQAQGLWHDPAEPERSYARVIEVDLSSIEPSASGPSRPHDRFLLRDARERFRAVCAERGLDCSLRVDVSLPTGDERLAHGTIALAAITSCTTAADPRMMLAAGLAARNAVRAGLAPKPWVKCVFAPGSHAGTVMLQRAGLMEALQRIGFHPCGFGCMSCIGNSGPIAQPLQQVSDRIELASVLSGNRNFEGRISPDVSQNYLMQPAAVIAYALAGTMDFDVCEGVLGHAPDGSPVRMADIMPDGDELDRVYARFVTAEAYEQGRRETAGGAGNWEALEAPAGSLFAWDDASTYVRRPPYFEGMGAHPAGCDAVCEARALAKLGDFITTDHISPAGSIALGTPAARYLQERGVEVRDFNTLGSRRGNHEVMMRGTFANVKLANELVPGKRGGWSFDFCEGAVRPLFDVSERYRSEGVGMVVLAGCMYGSGSSRDWAAKGPKLLGVRAVLAKSFERIHRSNLVGMGIVPLQFLEGQGADELGLDGSERYTVRPIDFAAGLPSPREVAVRARRDDGGEVTFRATVRVDTPTEGRYLQHGGILPFVLRNLVEASR
ncbi:aconitate hydratase [Berryella wangjianweii]|uniref:aconitate hydratase n=1 Tax=Berryella wangjianweii TaxID=2734634 RepID=UPI0021BDD8B7|nr:aconitate hydratase AcnA [Berryella wangjianweii]